MYRLPDPPYLRFPFGAERPDGAGAPAMSRRVAHVREQIEQVLFTNPGERVFRPEFGGGLKRLVFEPNNSVLWETTRKRLASTLAETLQGEVDPKTIEVEVIGETERLAIRVSYVLATIGYREVHGFPISGGQE